MNTSRLSFKGKLLSQFSGGDILAAPDGINHFRVHNDFIEVMDCNQDTYRIDFHGNLVGA